MLASIFSVAQSLGYPTLFLLILAESAGLPTPGETALVTAAILAAQGRLQIGLVIVIAALAAVIGDNLGYLVARKGGRRLMLAPGPFARSRRRVLKTGEPFFKRHGAKAVFFGRWIMGLRTWASWLAGAVNMPWRSFALWNAIGGISWATTIGSIAYLLGQSAGSALGAFAIFGIVTALVTAASMLLISRRQRPVHTEGQGRLDRLETTIDSGDPDALRRTPDADQTRCPASHHQCTHPGLAPVPAVGQTKVGDVPHLSAATGNGRCVASRSPLRRAYTAVSGQSDDETNRPTLQKAQPQKPCEQR